MKTKFRIAAVGAMAACSLSMVAAPSFAQTVDPTGPINLIDAQANTTLNVHKYLGDTTNLPANGQPVQNVPGTPLEGIAFDAYQVIGVNLTTNEGWDAARDLSGVTVTAADIAAGSITGTSGTVYTLGPVQTVMTDANGTASFVGLPIGLYLLNENIGGSVYDGAGALSPSAPVLITLPMTDPDGADGVLGTADDNMAWDYSIDVYPKNQANSIVKTVLDGNQEVANEDAYVVGKNLTYRVETSINVTDTNGDTNVTGADLGYYFVGDKLPAEVTYQSATVSIIPVDTAAAPIVLDPATDYVLVTDGDYVKVSMTEAGLDKLAANDDATVRTDIVAVVDAMPTDGSVENTATFIPSDAWWQSNGDGTPLNPGDNPGGDNPGVPSDEVISKFGDIVIQKVDAQAPTTTLAGATFAVYRDLAGDGCTAADVTGDPVATSAATDAAGMTSLNGLQLSNWYNGAEQTVLHTYCLVETQAPTGYQLKAEPIAFNLTVEGDVVDLTAAYADAVRDADATDATGGNLQVGDIKDNLDNGLPLTGGAGVGAGIGGLALLGGGAGLWALSKKRKDGDD